MGRQLTKAERVEWGEYLRESADRLGLRDWTIDLCRTLDDEEPDDEGNFAMATCAHTYGRRHAVIKLHEKFLERRPDEQRHYIAHELTHCHFAPVWNQTRDDLTTLLGKPADTVFWAAWRQNMEYGVDGVAEQLARLLPLPPK